MGGALKAPKVQGSKSQGSKGGGWGRGGRTQGSKSLYVSLHNLEEFHSRAYSGPHSCLRYWLCHNSHPPSAACPEVQSAMCSRVHKVQSRYDNFRVVGSSVLQMSKDSPRPEDLCSRARECGSISFANDCSTGGGLALLS